MCLYVLVGITLFSSCKKQAEPEKEDTVDRFGKNKNLTTRKKHIWQIDSIEFERLPVINGKVLQAIKSNIYILKKKNKKWSKKIGDLTITRDDLLASNYMLSGMPGSSPYNIENNFNLYHLKGKDGKGNVEFTGYYTPVMEISESKNEEFNVPILLPTLSLRNLGKSEILNGNIPDDAKILGYASSLSDLSKVRLQGSALVTDQSGKERLLQYLDRTNASKGESYPLFSLRNQLPKGSGGTSLVPLISVSADPSYIPPGSILLALTPETNTAGQFIKHNPSLLMVQDEGHLINGYGHLDMYFGKGRKAGQLASGHKHFGQIWLILPKKN
jgi:membrane-bound lytic murein transglycosylase A